MKKILLMVLVLSLMLVGCNNANLNEKENNEVVIENNDTVNNNQDNIEDVAETKPEETRSLEQILEEIYMATGLELPKTMNTPVNADNMIYMLGVDNFDFLEAIASEPMMSSIAHSVVLVKVDKQADLETIKKDIKENVDGRKWICVGVEEDNIRVENVGQYIFLVMDENSQVFVDAFYTVME